MEDKDKLVTLEDLGVAYSDVKADLTNKADVIVSSASGTIASVSDASASKVKKAVLNIEPVQDLHGQDYPYPAGGGRNLLNPDTVPELNQYIQYSNGVVSGTPGSGEWRHTVYLPVTPGTKLFFGQVNAVASSAGTAFYSEAKDSTFLSGVSASSLTAKNNIITVPENASYMRHSWRIDTGYNTNWQNTVYITLNSNPHSWSPYENICPISGHTSVDASRTGVNVWDEEWELGGIGTNGTDASTTDRIRTRKYIPIVPNTTYYAVFPSSVTLNVVAFYDADKNHVGSTYFENAHRARTTPANAYFMRFQVNNAYGTTYNHDISINYPSTDHDYHAYNGQSVTYQLGQTVYAGTLTINEDGSGTIVSTDGYIASYNGETLPSTRISDRDVYTVGTVPTTGAEVVYKLAAPVTIHLTAQEVLETLKGQNNLWHDANGDTEVQYRADTKLYIDNKFAELQTLIANS